MTQAKTTLLEAVRAFGGDALRDLWLFDQSDHEALYLRADVEAKLADVDVPRHIDNERYGYITRDTYNQLHYAEYAYTIRGFDSYEQFRTFVDDDGLRVGLFASFDRRDGGYDFSALHDRVSTVFAGHDAGKFVPDETPDAHDSVVADDFGEADGSGDADGSDGSGG